MADELTPTAHQHIKDLISGAEIVSSREYENVVDCHVVHPKRKIDPTSFVRQAKKKGLIVGSIPSASNRNKIIVAYITVADRSAELCCKTTNEGPVHVQVRFNTR